MPTLLLTLLAIGGLQGAGSLAGIVQTTDGVAVPRLTLTITGSASSTGVVTDDAGRFRVTTLALGEYQLTVVNQLLTLRVPVSVNLHGQAERVSLTVVPADVKESVNVSAPAAETPLSVAPGMTVSVISEQ